MKRTFLILILFSLSFFSCNILNSQKSSSDLPPQPGPGLAPNHAILIITPVGDIVQHGKTFVFKAIVNQVKQRSSGFNVILSPGKIIKIISYNSPDLKINEQQEVLVKTVEDIGTGNQLILLKVLNK